MPLRDHFRSPLDDVHSWDELHGMWPAMIVRELNEVLPAPYFAAPGIHLGTLYEIDVGTYEAGTVEPKAGDAANGNQRRIAILASHDSQRPARFFVARLQIERDSLVSR